VPETPAGDRPLARPGRIHVVGAGGSGMSSIATVLAAMGHDVSGSDLRSSGALARLAAAGVTTWTGHDPARSAGADVVTASTAVPADDPEVAAARAAGTPVWRRSEALAAICAERRTIAVAGTHGKTTTSAMLALVLEDAGWDPSYVIGGDLAGVGPGARWGQGEWLVVEADESDGTFVELGAEVAVVTNLEPDHLEHHGSFERLVASFDRFATDAPGARLAGVDDAGAAALAARMAGAGLAVETFGIGPSASWRAVDLEPGRTSITFGVTHEGADLGRASLAVPGTYNVRNALAAIAAACAVGVEPAAAVAGLGRFGGVGRRFEWRGERDGVTYVDDYGHLPGEVEAVLAAARDAGWPRVVAVFQPHRYSRTASLWRDFAGAFDDADEVVVTDVYASGEEPRPGIDGSLVAGAVRNGGHRGPVHYVPDLADLPGALDAILRPGDLCLTLGAGDLTTVVDRLVRPA
jgi:UDP-N-acetylmuramate--alanine ligase